MSASRVAFFLAFVLYCTGSNAYILPSGFMLNKYYEKRPSKLKSFRVELQTSLIGPEYDGGEVSGKEIWYIQLPMKFRSELELPRGKQIVVVSKGKRYTLEPGGEALAREVEAEPAMFDPVVNLLARADVKGKNKSFRAGDLFLADLNTAGIDTSVRGLTRMGDRIVIIIGAKEGDLDKPQIWFDKDRFVPVRYLSGGAEGLDVRYSDYITLNRKKWLPGKIEYYKAGRLVKVQNVDEVDLGWRAEPNLFDKPRPGQAGAGR